MFLCNVCCIPCIIVLISRNNVDWSGAAVGCVILTLTSLSSSALCFLRGLGDELSYMICGLSGGFCRVTDALLMSLRPHRRGT